MDEIHNTYKKKTPESARLFAESAKYHVNGVSHNIRYFEPYPFVVSSAAKSTITDSDGNAYTDYWMGHWSLILGHAPAPVAEALHRQIDAGWMYGTVNEQTLRLSAIISKAVCAAEKIRYTASGTEAVMYAARLARAYTGRGIIAKIDGGWHGYATDVLKSVNWPFDAPECAGVTSDANIVSVPYNDLDASIRILQKYKNDLAGIIIEPLLGGAGCIPASAEYLAGMQEFARKSGALFILDEIVTGFRFRYGCMYPQKGITDPDIVTLGKIIGGGLPAGAVCGTKEVMQCADTARGGRGYIGGGTFSANPASMTAGSATLEHLKNNTAAYDRINEMGSSARKMIADAFVHSGSKPIITGAGSLFMVHFPQTGKKDIQTITDARQAAECDQSKLRKYHLKMIAKDGIFMLPGKLGAVSAAHTQGDIERLAAASEEFGRSLPAC